MQRTSQTMQPTSLSSNTWAAGLLLAALFAADSCLADDAEVLPKGVSRVRLEANIYDTVDTRFDPDGKEEDVAADYNSRLDSNVFGALGSVEQFFGMPAGSATIGDSVVDFEYDFELYNLWFEHGVTEKLSLGIKIPYWKVKNTVNAEVDNGDATVGKNPLYTGAPCGGGVPVPDPNLCLAPVVPLSVGGIPLGVPFETEDVQNLLGAGLDVNGDGSIDVAGYGYDRVKSYRNSDFADIEAGFRYQYLSTPKWRLAFTGGMRFPTGEIDDPDNLTDFATGDGTYDILLRFNNDYIVSENLFVNLTLGYDVQLPDEETLRVIEAPDKPITINKEKVDRDLGNVFALDLEGHYKITDAWGTALRYRYASKEKDDIDGDLGLSYEALEKETDRTEHEVYARLSYNTIPLYKKKAFPVPLDVSLVYRERFDGSNNALKSQYWGGRLMVYF